MSVLTTSQLTFCDLKDSYTVHVDTECIPLACTTSGIVLDKQEVNICYYILMGNNRIPTNCEVSGLPSGVSLKSVTESTDTDDGIISLIINKDATLDNKQSPSIKIVFTTDNEEKFEFERHIAFVKCMAGAVGETGATGASLQVKYLSSATAPTITNNDVSSWSNTIPDVSGGKKIYMTQKLSTETKWSTPVQLSATDGTTPTVTIINGYWHINGESTGVKAEGKDGETPNVAIGLNGNWYIDGQDSGTKAQGEAGKDGKDGKDGAEVEYVYYRSEEAKTLTAPSYTGSTLTSGWTSSPQGITEKYKYEYMSMRKKPAGGSWGAFSTPVIWSKWGEKGQDGDGVEYKYYLSNSSDTPSYSIGASGWTDEPTGVSSINQYEYVVQIKDGSASNPALWAKYGVKGDKGDQGEDGIGMSIYSTQGLMFKEDLTEIELEVGAFEGSTNITNASYQWQYWDKTANSGKGAYISINNATSRSLVVKRSDSYALVGLKCVMVYKGKTYEAYVSLFDEAIIYTAQVKFFNGTNIFTASDLYLVAYIELYKNNEKIETPISEEWATTYCTGVANIAEGGLIEATINQSFSEGDRMYFVCNNITVDNSQPYKIVLGELKSDGWYEINRTFDYIYTNDLYPELQSNIIAISKENINKSKLINFTISKDAADLTDTSVNVIDSNDPIISNVEPNSPAINQLWLDTSYTPNILKICNGIGEDGLGIWVECAERAGGAIYTSYPSSYKAGDLWILSEEDANKYFDNQFGEGSMLKATVDSNAFKASDWVDADQENTQLKQDIKQYFEFNTGTGLRIGQTNNQFFVNISATNMAFCSTDNNGTASEVVEIGINSATIQNATFVGDQGTTFNNNTTFTQNATFNQQLNMHKQDATTGFTWQIEESNGSLSLVAMNLTKVR